MPFDDQLCQRIISWKNLISEDDFQDFSLFFIFGERPLLLFVRGCPQYNCYVDVSEFALFDYDYHYSFTVIVWLILIDY